MIIFVAKNTKIAPKVKGQAEMSPKSNHIIEFAIRRIHVKLCRFLIRSFLSLLRWKKMARRQAYGQIDNDGCLG